MNIGLLLANITLEKKGIFCFPCIHSYFWGYTLGNLILGWWGIKSFFLTLFFLNANAVFYFRALWHDPTPLDPAGRIELDSESINKIQTYQDEITTRILKGESINQIADDLALRSGIPAEHFRAFHAKGW